MATWARAHDDRSGKAAQGGAVYLARAMLRDRLVDRHQRPASLSTPPAGRMSDESKMPLATWCHLSLRRDSADGRYCPMQPSIVTGQSQIGLAARREASPPA